MRDDDQEKLRLLSIFYFVLGALSILGVLVLVAIAAITRVALPPESSRIGAAESLVLVSVGGILAVWGLLLIRVGVRLRQQRGYVFCMVMAALACLSFPLGTALGGMTLYYLTTPTMKALWGRVS